MQEKITEQFITFDTAKLAKEKGLTEGGVTWLFYREDGTVYNNEYDSDNQFCICCTQELLKKWLREKHNIHVNPEPYIKSIFPGDSYFAGYYVGSIYNSDGKEIGFIEDYNYITYEEALEFGLQTALKLL